MKFLLLLLLLTSWTHLGSEAQICNANITLKHQLINIEESRAAKADAYFLKAYKSKDLESCLQDCCSSKYGECSVAAYKNGGRDWTCIHCFCNPISLCKFFKTDVADSFMFPPANASTPTTSTRATVIHEVIATAVNIDNALKDHERSVAARKGVENFPITLNYLTDQENNASENISLIDEHDVSIKSSKGVEFYNYNSTSLLSNMSVIKPRKGVETEDNFGNHNSKSKIKPRKGVVPFISTPLPNLPLLTEILQLHTLEHNDTLRNKNDLLSFLRDVFSDDTNITETKVPETTYTPTSIMPSAVLRTWNTSSVTHHFLASKQSTISYSSSVTTVPHQSQTLHHKESIETTVLHTSFASEPVVETTTASLDQNQWLPSLSSLPSTPLKQESIESTISSSQVKSEFLTFPSSSVVDSSVNFSTKLVSQSLNNEIKPSQNDGDENDRRYKSSMHLVFGLVFGLLVVFGVFGAIVKRIYDVWVRRHYRRMDFLIDGMYD